ncbi:MAG: hypothetical protein U0704_16975 [Candidatus Eisenbacteria bacterium]
MTAWTFAHARDYGFAQDDWTALARVRGLAPAPPPLWRWLSQQACWRLVAGPLGADARTAHTLAVAALAACSALLGGLLARRVRPAAALVGGAYFAAHFALFHEGYWLSASGDTFALLCSLLAAAACAAGGAARWAALPAFALALGAKESAIALPLALGVAACAVDDSRARFAALVRDPLAWALAALAVAWALVVRVPAAGGALGGEAYAFSPRAIGPNLQTYAAWAANCWWPTLRDIGDAVAPKQFAWGLGLLGAGLASAVVPATRARGAAAAFAAFVLLLAPVLPLASHTYHYYLALPLAALAWWVAVLLDTALAAAPAALAWTAGGALAAAIAWNGHAIARNVERLPWRDNGQRSEAIMDRALIAERALADLRAHGLAPDATVVFWSPQSQAIAAQEGKDPAQESYDEHNFRAALAEGLAARVALPNVREVRFARAFAPASATEWWAIYRPEGRLRVMRADTLAAVLAAGPPR